MLTRKLCALLVGYLTPLQIALVTNEHEHHIRISVRPCFLQPLCEVVEGVPSGDVVNQKCAGGPPVVGSGDGPETLLSGGVPDLQLDLLPLDGYQPRSELHSDSEVMIGSEALVCELEKQARLAHP